MKSPKQGAIVVVNRQSMMIETAFGTSYEKTCHLRKGQLVELVKPGKNTSWAWIVKEGDYELMYAVELCFLRRATKAEKLQYKSLLKVIE